MTREEIEREYQVENGIIRSPGKFEGEAVYVPYFWDIYLDGFADEDDGTTLIFNVSVDDKKHFPELRKRKVVKLYQRDDGFVVEC